MVQLSGSEWIVVLVLSVVWAVLGYQLSEHDRRRLGRTPWGLPSMVWAFFWFLSLILGLVLYLIAHSVGVRKAHQNPPPLGTATSETQYPMAPPRTLSAAEQFPAYPRPANSQPTPSQPIPPQPADVQATVPSAQDPAQVAGSQAGGWPSPPPAWHPDPSGRFHYRWWDGHQWTSNVSIDGQQLIDTNPDQRIGPY
ncbi:MAG: DUF2510 domain-containing protein [Acidimicrobiales bacterium]